MHCSTVLAVELAGLTEISTGLFTKPLASSRISVEKVAENSRFWRFSGNNFSIL
ncbi:Uncharacterised protein [Vibrio cholerae]|uniref:Uncharacterized protein n=1 Tax=Vibrio cholerae TaxID=666 RepID=A0A655ZH69_VIBCL|nr:Uncharacterised protein [Vibrio cholerae]CSB07642.1 Uncharacterised protein [Vibrio cholerae]CSB89741.1 Uncharacterised protein [Vibrio cholerae]CSC20552.1 Uncharacterised protein [Vibrio cholerae]CSC69485.1 Uncharacterised protein [Vibrio cholerae]